MTGQALFNNADVKSAYESFPENSRRELLVIRDLIFQIASKDEAIGPLEECLKWGQPSYLTSQSKSGTAIRLACTKSGKAALFVHCQTSLISEFKAIFNDQFEYEGNRALIIPELTKENLTALSLFIGRALTYHR